MFTLIAILVSGLTFLQQHQPVYAVLGPEAEPILRVLVGEQQVISIQPGELSSLISRRPIAALVLPEEWSAVSDVKVAEASAIPVLRVHRQTSISAILLNIEQLAAATHTTHIGAAWIADLRQGIAAVKASVANQPRVRVLILSPEGYTQGQDTLITELITLAGGLNTAADANIPEARQVDDSQILAFAPDVVLLVNWTPQAASFFTSNPIYHGLGAFTRSHVHRIPPPGKDPTRLLADLALLADLLHSSLL